MHTYITAICNDKISLKELNTAGETFDINFEECENQSIKTQILHTENYFLLPSRTYNFYCALGLDLHTRKQNAGKGDQRIIANLKNKGWSEAKLERYFVDKQKKENIRDQVNEIDEQKESNELNNYMNFVKTLFKTSTTTAFGLLYRMDVISSENQKIKITNRKKVLLKNLTTQNFSTLDENELLYITK